MRLEQFIRDLRFGLRNLRRTPGFTLVALLSLALGIGVNAAIFTLLNGLVIETLPVSRPERLVEVQVLNRSSGEYENFFSYSFYRELSSRNTIFDKTTAEFGFSLFELQLPQGQERVNGLYVTGSYFDFLHATPYLGRLLTAKDDEIAGAQRVCVLSYQLWRNAFGGDAQILGKTITINGKRIEVVGITKPQFTGLGLQNGPDLELPTSEVDYVAQSLHRNDAKSFQVQILARLKQGISEQDANERLGALANRIKQSLAQGRPSAGSDTYRAKPAPRGFDEQKGMAQPLVVLMSTVALVLLIACLNLANLLLARGQTREREIAMRLSLGASRWHIIRQLSIENAYLAAGGTILGLVAANGLLSFLLTEFNKGKAYGQLDLSLDWRVIVFTALVGTAAMLLFGSVPAWIASSARPGSGLQGAGKGGAS